MPSRPVALVEKNLEPTLGVDSPHSPDLSLVSPFASLWFSPLVSPCGFPLWLSLSQKPSEKDPRATGLRVPRLGANLHETLQVLVEEPGALGSASPRAAILFSIQPVSDPMG